MEKMLVCHQCGNETEYTCDGCGEPVCEDCCVPMTYHNQIDYPLCTTCHEGNEADRVRDYREKERIEEEKEAKRKQKNAKRKANYWKPHNVEKREKARAKRKKEEAELARKRFEEVMKIVGSMFR